MREDRNPVVAVVDYGLGNLFSVRLACERVGLRAEITSARERILAADAVILPGVGAFGDAMRMLRTLDFVAVLRDLAASPVPLVGICLGMQLLMDESHEFGRHQGLGIIAGDVVRLPHGMDGRQRLKVPQVGWNRIDPTGGPASWNGTLLDGVSAGASMYFVHSYYVRPREAAVAQSTTPYGSVEFCSSLSRGSVFACQYHPERSGPDGLRIYRNLARRLCAARLEERDVCHEPNTAG